MATLLAEKTCTACRGDVAPVKGTELETLRSALHDAWQVVDESRLEREFKFKNFVQALAFTNAVGGLAEEQNHHPDIYLSWGKVRITLWTHKAGGLTENDFILAAKIDGLA